MVQSRCNTVPWDHYIKSSIFSHYPLVFPIVTAVQAPSFFVWLFSDMIPYPPSLALDFYLPLGRYNFCNSLGVQKFQGFPPAGFLQCNVDIDTCLSRIFLSSSYEYRSCWSPIRTPFYYFLVTFPSCNFAWLLCLGALFCLILKVVPSSSWSQARGGTVLERSGWDPGASD